MREPTPTPGFRFICHRCSRHFWSVQVVTDCPRCRSAQWKAFPYADIEVGEASGA
ncbi:hypothetical protein PROPHIGD36-2_18 [Mycobacterium phage prophiGD36-2]|nr:hypothetical protein PROPHIGD36-2_18 [Mycobacterium phage prophiGD36-2]